MINIELQSNTGLFQNACHSCKSLKCVDECNIQIVLAIKHSN